MCFFPRVAAVVSYELFQSYCSSILGSELWHLSYTLILLLFVSRANRFQAYLKPA